MEIESVLRELSLADLSALVGTELIDGLSDLSVSTTKSSLIDLLLTARGLSFLENKKNRELFFSKPAVVAALGLRPEQAKKIAKGSWATATPLVAELFNVDPSDLTTETKKREGTLPLPLPNGALFPYQNWMRRDVWRHFQNQEGRRTLVHMPTGAGKTRTAMNIIMDQIRPRVPGDVTVVWMAHSDELCEQAVQSFQQIWSTQGLTTSKIWRMWGGQTNLEDYDGSGCNLVVTSFQTLHGWIKTSKNEQFKTVNRVKRHCVLLVVDEAHLSIAPTYKQAIEYISGVTANIVGLTATPGRDSIEGDGEETLKLSKFYQNHLITMRNDEGNDVDDPIHFLQSKGVLSQVEQLELPGLNIQLSPHEMEQCRDQLEIPDSVLRILGNDAQRNLLIAAKTLKLAIEEKKKTIVFCPSKSNSQVLAEYLKIRGCSAAAITGDLPMSVRQKKLRDFQDGKIDVLTNFNVLTTGFDAPNIGAVVIARPTLSVVLYSQMIGRGLRGSLFGGTETTTIVNVKDNIVNLPDFRAAFVHFNEFFAN